MKTSVHVAASLLLAAFAVGSCGPEPTLTVTPSTGLQDGQQVTVTLEHFKANSDVLVRQCTMSGDGAHGNGGCASGISVRTDANGNARATLTIRKHVTYSVAGAQYSVDCGYRGFCAVAAADLSPSRWSPLSFAGELTPNVTVTPSSNIKALHAELQVTGNNVPPQSRIDFSMCPRGSDSGCGAESSTTASDAGTFAGKLVVSDFLPNTDCSAPGACEIRTRLNGFLVIDRTTLAFSTAPAAHVSPTTNLRPSASLEAIGAHFPPSAKVELLQCLRGGDLSTCESRSTLRVGEYGGYYEQLTVHRVFAHGVCDAPGKCELRTRLNDELDVDTAPLDFMSPPAVIVTPTSELKPIQEVTIEIRELDPGQSFEIQLCVASDPERCGRIASGVARPDGSYAGQVTLHWQPECAAPGKCSVKVDVGLDFGDRVPLSFKAIGENVHGTVEAPPGPFVAGNSLELRGLGWASNTAVHVGDCPNCRSDYVFADAAGSFTANKTVRAFQAVRRPSGMQGVFFSSLRDCTGSPGNCALHFSDFRDISAAPVSVPLDVRAASVPTGVATIETSMPLPGSLFGVPIIVSGSGWSPRRELEAYQCTTSSWLDPTLLCVELAPIRTDEYGRFRAAQIAFVIALGQVIPEDPYTFSCNGSGSCVLLVADSRATLASAARVPLQFR